MVHCQLNMTTRGSNKVMGYRSEVSIVVSKACYVKHLVLNDLPEFLKEFTKQEHKKCILWEIHDVKWYATYAEVDEVNNWLGALNEMEYGFIRVGEETNDIEVWGSPYEFGLAASTAIVFEEW